MARKYGAPFEVESCKAKFFEIYMAKYALPGLGIGHVGARQLVEACRAAGLKTAVASSADLVKVGFPAPGQAAQGIDEVDMRCPPVWRLQPPLQVAPASTSL